MAMNPQNVLSSLRMMSDQQLQQYAAMHKNDPFIFPLAFQESQMRKQMRSESQAMQPPAPKVADQALASMAAEPLPEEVGIGALPAQNLEGMAAGGIVAFDEGGEVPRFSGTTGSFVGPQFGLPELLKQLGITTQEFMAATPDQQKAIREMAAAAGGQPTPTPASAATAATPAAAARTPTMTERGITAIGNAASSAGKYLSRGLGAFAKYSPAAMVAEGLFGTSPEERAIVDKAVAGRLGKAAGDVLAQYGLDKGMASPPASQADVDATMGVYAPPPAWASGEGQATGNKGAAPGGQGGAKVPPGPATPQVAMPQMPATKAPSIEDAKKLSGQFIDRGTIMKSVDDFNKMNEEGIAALEKAREEGKPAGKAYEEYERIVKNRADELASDKETAKGEALLTAGLAVLGGSSPFALQNLSLATKGVEQYRDAMKDIKKAARENEKALADIEQSRRAEGREDWKEAQNYKEKAFDRRLKGKEMGVKAIMDLGVKDGEIASRLYDTSLQTNAALERTLIQERGQTARTNAMLAAPGQQEKLFATLGGGDPVAGLGVYAKAMGPGVRDDAYNRAKAFHDWSNSPVLRTQYPDFLNYYRMQSMGGPTTSGASGASTGNWGTATVVPQPGR